MRKFAFCLSSFLLVNFLVVGLVFAQTDASAGQAVSESTADEPVETVTAADLGVENAGILPTNPFYFLKNWRNGIQLFFTFNPVKKAELELKIADQKAAELKKVQETRPDDERGIELALQNYQQAQEGLKTKLEALKETSQNPNVEKLLDKLADRVVKHEKLMDEIAQKLADREKTQDLIRDAKEKIEEAAVAASKKDEVAKFVSKLERALIESKGGELKQIRSVEILDRLEQKAPEELRQSLEKLRQDFTAEFQKDLEVYLKNVDSAVAQQEIIKLPGDPARRSLILKEIKEVAKGKSAEVLKGVKEDLDKTVSDEKNIVQNAKDQLKSAKERIEQLKTVLKGKTDVPAVVKDLLLKAQNGLKTAQSAFVEEKYGEAFGQAQSAEVHARNALQMLEKTKSESEQLQAVLKQLEATINKWEEVIKSRGYTMETQPKIFDLIKNVRQNLDLAKDVLAKNDLASVKNYIGQIKASLSIILEWIGPQVKSVIKPAIRPPEPPKPIYPESPTTLPEPITTPPAVKDAE